MIEKIIRALRTIGAEHYIIRETREESNELFFIRRRRDMTRAKDVTRYLATLYRDFEKDGARMRGDAVTTIFPGMSDAEIQSAVLVAYAAAEHVKNSWFELPDPAVGEKNEDALDLSCAASKLADGLFRADQDADAFINSAEIFATRRTVRIVTSRGADVKYTSHTFRGEFIAQCTSPRDVELYRDFEYDTPDADALEAAAREMVTAARDRARAEEAPKAGTYTLLLSDKHLSTLLNAYLDKSAASMVYAKYSNFAIGASVQGEEVLGERLNLKLRAREPFSDEGIPMEDRELIRDGKLLTFYGATRFCRYLGIEPTGMYSKISLENGTLPMSEMKKEPYIHPVAFSDFQMDAFSGHFAGEIRLAYVFDGQETRVVTGGSINGSLLEAQGDLAFSLERYRDATYEGPYAVRIKGVRVAGD